MNALMPIRTTGRATRELEAHFVRELTRADVAALDNDHGTKPPALKRISERHHALARTLASGTSLTEAAIICRYELPRVSMLQHDPAFRELVEFYRGEVTEKYLGLHEQLATLSADATTLIQDQLERDLELDVSERKLSVGQLLEVTKLGADRTGHGPQTSALNLNVNVDLASRVPAARQRVAARQVIDQ